MTKTYAIADLHGRFDLLLGAYEAIAKHAEGAPGTIVHLGDYVDRGPQSRQIIEFLMDKSTVPGGMTRHCLRGNHEDIMSITCGTANFHPGWWIGNGGTPTLTSYGAVDGETIKDAINRVPAAHVEWMTGLPRLHVDAHRVFVHAGVQASLPLEDQDDEKMGWMLYPDGAADGHGDRHVVHGHHQFAEGPLRFFGRTDLDTFAWATGRLVVGVFDDDVAGGPVDFLEVRGPADERFHRPWREEAA